MDTMMVDHVPHTGNNQNQTARACFQKVVYVLRELGVEKLGSSLVGVASFDLFVARVYEWSDL